MRVVRFSREGDVGFGVLDGDPPVVVEVAGHPLTAPSPTGQRYPLDEVRTVAPILPSKIVAVGENYAEHAREIGGAGPAEEPVIFLKPSSAVIGPGDPITHPKQSERVDHEAELAVVVGRLCRDVPPEQASRVIFGYTCANDVTARDLQQRDGQWTRAKGFDTFCPLGPWIQTHLDTSDLGISATVGAEPRQSGRTSQMVHSVPALISYISAVMTLIPGDVVLTGTPAGVGPLRIGDEVSVTVDGIGTVTNRVVSRD